MKPKFNVKMVEEKINAIILDLRKFSNCEKNMKN